MNEHNVVIENPIRGRKTNKERLKSKAYVHPHMEQTHTNDMSNMMESRRGNAVNQSHGQAKSRTNITDI